MTSKHAQPSTTLCTTTRLRLRTITTNDVDALYALESDPEIRRYDHGTSRPTRDTVRTSLMPRAHAIAAEGEGLGHWIAECRETAACLGWFHLRRAPSRGNRIAIGYRLPPSEWGRGYATEGALALVRYAFGTLAAPSVIALALVENHASIRVMQKIGMTENDRFSIDDGAYDLVEYRITALGYDAMRARAQTMSTSISPPQ